MIIRRGDDPGPFSHPRDYVEFLREVFGRRCAYCRTPDDQTGRLEGMRVDHFVPESRDQSLRLEWSNLYYSCDTCNNRKSNFPTDRELNKGLRFVDPCSEDPDSQFQMTIDPVTRDYCQVLPRSNSPPAGYTIRRLQFNRRSDLREFWRELHSMERQAKQQRQSILELQSLIGTADSNADWLLSKNDRWLKSISERWPFPRTMSSGNEPAD